MLWIVLCQLIFINFGKVISLEIDDYYDDYMDVYKDYNYENLNCDTYGDLYENYLYQ